MVRNLELTTNEKKALVLIDKYNKRFNTPPSMRYVARELGMWPRAGVYIVGRLRFKGYLLANAVKPSAKARSVL